MHAVLCLTWLLVAVVVESVSATSTGLSSAVVLSYGCAPPNAPRPIGTYLHKTVEDPTPFLCGTRSVLSFTMELSKASTALSIPANTSFPMTLQTKGMTCKLQDEVDLEIMGSQITSTTNDAWIVTLNVSFPSRASEDDVTWDESEKTLGLSCPLTALNQAFTITTSFPPYTFLTDDWAIANLTLVNLPTTLAPTTGIEEHEVPSTATTSSASSGVAATVGPTKSTKGGHRLKKVSSSASTTSTSSTSSSTPVAALGIGKVAKFRIDLTGPHATVRSAGLTGSCVINGHNSSVVDGVVDYLIQSGDSDVHGLTYACNLMDVVGYTRTRNDVDASGVIRHASLEIDGTLPALDDEIFMLFSTDKPARIGSVISITLRARNLTQGYAGTCTVNGVANVPLLEAEDHGFYMIQYTVNEGDTSLEDDTTMPLHCAVHNRVGNTIEYTKAIPLGFPIDAVRPKMATTSLLFSSDRPAHEGSIIEIQITFAENEPHLRVATNESCLVNNASVGASFSKSTSNAFLITYVVGKGEAMWKAGALPIHCLVQDAAGNTALIDHFTDGNTLFARELKPIEVDTISTEFLPDKLLITSFVIVAIASHSISKVCPHVGLPRITGYIVTGILVGPYVLNFVQSHQIRQLRIIDELSMAYIGLTAGSKLHWHHMRPILKSILAVTIGLTVFEYIVGTLTITVLAGYIDFLQDTTDSEKYAIALLAGCMMIARSPSSALAVIEETKSQGHFTTLIFAVTVMCDVIVIFLFNVNSMITESFLSEKTMSSRDILRLVAQLCGSMGVGVVLGRVLGVVVFWRPRQIKRKSVWFTAMQIAKQVLILVYGWGIFVLCHLAHPYLEPLLCCMVSGAVMWNSSANPEELGILLKKLADLVYVCFFTITGATLELDMLVKAMALSLVLCGTRIVSIFMGSFVGGVVAGEDRGHCKVAWMAYITQAGVTLGLAKQIQLLYPGWGSYFSTMIVAVVICNQLIGPPLLRYVLRFVGDAKKKEIGKVDGLTALVFSGHSPTSNKHSTILRLEMCGWNVHSHEVQAILPSKTDDDNDDKTRAYSDALLADVLEMLRVVKPLEVVVVMMPTDRESYEVIRAIMAACQQLRRIRVLRVVVQVAGSSSTETKWAARFADMPTTEEHGDTIDVVVIDRIEATDMLIELAACGKVVQIADKQEDTTAIAMEDGDTDLEEDRGRGSSLSSGVRLRQSLKHTVRRIMLV